MDHKNPVVIAILGTCLSFTYFYLFHYKKDNKNKKDKTEDKDRKTKLLFVYPIAIGIVLWFLSSCYFDNGYDVCAEITSPRNSYILKTDGEPMIGGKQFKSPLSSTEIIGRNNIRLPSNDVFIDLARF